MIAIIDEGMLDPAARLRELGRAVMTRYRNYEIVVVDNGLSVDTMIALRDLLAEEPCFRVLRLARRSSIDTAVFAGLEAAIGDFVVISAIAYDRQEHVLDVLDLLRDGHDVVQGESRGPLGGGPFARAGRRTFYWYNRRFLDVDIPARSTYLTGLTRSAANSLGAARRTHRYLRHLIRYIGYRVTSYRYDLDNPQARRIKPRPRLTDAIEMVSSYSTHPLRVVTLVGVVAGLLNLLYALYVIVVTLVSTHVTQGWPTTSLQLSAMFFIICTVLAVQAEYIGRILSESRREPGYVITEELESETLITERERLNVAAA
ncbi:glycosyltransferase [Amnibacterium kyonggiense]|uniref:glycosyltransferase n=1 Tax=Amnibacterium kyonggiense TaxID=595671 RepID=UPI0031D45B31